MRDRRRRVEPDHRRAARLARAQAARGPRERLQATRGRVAREDDDRVSADAGDVDEAPVGRDRDRVGAAERGRDVAARGRASSVVQPAMPASWTSEPFGWRANVVDRARRRRRDVDVQAVGRDGDRRGALERAGVAAAGLRDRDEAAGREVELLQQAGVGVDAERRDARGRRRRRRRATRRRGSGRPPGRRRGRAPRVHPSVVSCETQPPSPARLRERAGRRGGRTQRHSARARRAEARGDRYVAACTSGCHGTPETASP